MVVSGRVINGVIVLREGVILPEGQEVSVVVPAPPEERRHSVLDIPPVSLGGPAIRPIGPDDDLLQEMLEGRV